jgi:hypothetical protein
MLSQPPEPLTVVITLNTASVGRNAYADVRCPACGRHLQVLVEGSKRNRKVNERICQESDGGCGSNLIILDEEGNELNEPWATLESNLSRTIGEMFHADAFPDRITAQKWAALERSESRDVIHTIALAQKERYTGLGRSIWAQLIASASKGSAQVVPEQRSAGVLEFPPDVPDSMYEKSNAPSKRAG